MKNFILVILSFLIAGTVFANIGENPYSTIKNKTLTYKSYYKGDKVGKATITIKEDSINYYNKFKIRAYLVFTYNYKANLDIKFDTNGVSYVKSKTNDDGKKFKFTISNESGKLVKNKKNTIKEFKGLSLNFVFSKKMKSELTSSWKHFKILDVERGKVTKFKQKSGGTKTIKVNGKQYNTFLVKWVKGPRKGKSYYDNTTGILVRSDVTKGGNTLTMKLQ